MIKKVYILLLLAFFFIENGMAQNAAQDFKKINNAYVVNNSLGMDLKYIYYKDEQVKRATEIKKGYFKRKGNKIASNLMGIRTIQNEHYMWMINNENRVIVVSKPKISFEMPLVFPIDSILTLCKSVEFKKLSKEEYAYELGFNKNADNYRSVTITYHPNSYFIKNIIISFSNPVLTDINDESSVKKVPQLVISYSNITTQPNLSAISFSEQHYFEIKENKIVGKGQYKEYTFINNILVNEK